MVTVWSSKFFFFFFHYVKQASIQMWLQKLFAEMAKGLAVQTKHLRHDRHYAVLQLSADMYRNV